MNEICLKQGITLLNTALSQNSNYLSVVIILFIFFNRSKANTFETKPLNTFNNLSYLFINKKKEYNFDQTTNMGENCQRRCIPIPPPSGFSAKMRDIMDLSWYNAELEMRYLSDEEIELLNQLRNY